MVRNSGGGASLHGSVTVSIIHNIDAAGLYNEVRIMGVCCHGMSSVCRLSVTRVYCDKMTEVSITRFAKRFVHYCSYYYNYW